MHTKKIIFWGHRSTSHTNHHIFASYKRAFEFLGFATEWFDNANHPSNYKYENSIFFTFGGSDQNIPLVPHAKYILHHCEVGRYINQNCQYIELANYLHDCTLGISPMYKEGGGEKIHPWHTRNTSVERLTYYSFWDEKNKTLYQPWGTNLLPHEIDISLAKYEPNKSNVYYIGSIWDENRELLRPFAKACHDHGKHFINLCSVGIPFRPYENLAIHTLKAVKEKLGGSIYGDKFRYINDIRMQKYIFDSYISPDLRAPSHAERGYIPCRVFKNISYGAIPATNSKFISDFFSTSALPFNADSYNLFLTNEEYLQSKHFQENALWLKNEVRTNHTFITRAKTLLQFI